jgi:hypothetical protein
MNRTYTRFKAFHIAFIVTFVLLVVQYVLGMISNLEVQFPGNLPNGNAWGWVWSHSLIIAMHISIGTLLLVVALVAVILSIVARNIVGIVAAIIGLGMIVFAWLSGAEFLALGQQNAFSLRMALGFMGAFVAYILGYYLSRSLRLKHTHTIETNANSLTASCQESSAMLE